VVVGDLERRAGVGPFVLRAGDPDHLRVGARAAHDGLGRAISAVGVPVPQPRSGIDSPAEGSGGSSTGRPCFETYPRLPSCLVAFQIMPLNPRCLSRMRYAFLE